MNCPFCANETKVLDSRVAMEGQGVRRRRKCVNCSFRFSTLEEAKILDLVVIKRNGAHQPYNREKIRKGLEIALRKRSYTEKSFHGLIRSIELNIHALKSSEITADQIGQIVMDNLREFDKVGYIRFASVYRQFEDVKTFEKELKKLRKRKYNSK